MPTNEEDVKLDLNVFYKTRTTEISNGKPYWSYLDVEVLFNGSVIGKYHRKYSNFYNTFYAFEHKGKHYALYSSDYQVTSLMSLPDCKHIASTESGFCPVDFYVPPFEESQIEIELYSEWIEEERAKEPRDEEKITRYKASLESAKKDVELVGTMGVVSGCHWGDDSGGWKMQYLSIDPEKGTISINKDVFGYFQLSQDEMPLSKKIVWERPDRLTIPISAEFDFNVEDKEKSTFNFYSFNHIKFGEKY